MTKKLMPFINKFDGEVKILTKSQGKHLNEDWARAKVVENEDGEQVFRFQLSSPVTGPDGTVKMGVATVDILETETQEVELDGKRTAE